MRDDHFSRNRGEGSICGALLLRTNNLVPDLRGNDKHVDLMLGFIQILRWAELYRGRGGVLLLTLDVGTWVQPWVQGG